MLLSEFYSVLSIFIKLSGHGYNALKMAFSMKAVMLFLCRQTENESGRCDHGNFSNAIPHQLIGGITNYRHCILVITLQHLGKSSVSFMLDLNLWEKDHAV